MNGVLCQIAGHMESVALPVQISAKAAAYAKQVKIDLIPGYEIAYAILQSYYLRSGDLHSYVDCYAR